MTAKDRRKPPILDDVRDIERRFLAGRREREEDLESAIRIFLEFLRGYESLDFQGPCVTVFGSARFKERHPYYQLARELGRALARSGFVVMTGGGPGIMEAVNRGAKEAGGYTVGCNIMLPREQRPNPYLDKFVEFDHFFVRKVMLVKYSCAFVILPGGFGTLDEAFEALTLVQCEKIDRFPIVAMGTRFWTRLRGFMRRTLAAERVISRRDLGLMKVTDSVDDAVRYVRRGVSEVIAHHMAQHLARPATRRRIPT